MARYDWLVTSALVAALLCAGRAGANPLDLTVSFTVSGEAGSYVYDFTVRNDSAEPIEVYSVAINAPGLTVLASPAGWGQAPFSPVQWCTNGDCFGNTGGIAPGSSLNGFIASSVDAIALTEVSYTVAIVGPTVASLGLPIASGDTAQYAGNGFALGAIGKRRFEILRPPGATSTTYTQAFALNDLGQVTINGEGELGGFSYLYSLEDCAFSDLGENFTAIDINNAGVMVGSTTDGLCAIRDEQGGITTFTPFMSPPGETFCQARGVNSAGKVVGYAVDEFGEWTGFEYDPAQQTLDQFFPSPQTFAHGINATGDVVGSVYLFADEAFPGSPEGRYGFRRDVLGATKYFAIAEALPGFSRGRGISDSGLITGFYTDALTFETRSFVTTVTPGTAFEEIVLSDVDKVFQKPCNPNIPPAPSPDYSLFTYVFASHVRDDGVVVGSCEDLYFNELTGDEIRYGHGFAAMPVIDTDGDSVVDRVDNCAEMANADQRDTDGDNFGNICDADFNNDCVINFFDLGVMKAAFFGSDSNADMNGDGTVNFSDLGLLKASFFSAPGPSGLPNACNE